MSAADDVNVDDDVQVPPEPGEDSELHSDARPEDLWQGSGGLPGLRGRRGLLLPRPAVLL